MMQVHGPSDVPKGPHYVALVFKQHTYTIPGDERSQTHPGHGYPESTTTLEVVEHWTSWGSDEAANFAVAQQAKGFKVVLYYVNGPLKVSLQVNVNLEADQ